MGFIIWLWTETSGGSCDHGDDNISIIGGGLLDQLNGYYFLKKEFAPWS
jgi:hypothetical protein